MDKNLLKVKKWAGSCPTNNRVNWGEFVPFHAKMKLRASPLSEVQYFLSGCCPKLGISEFLFEFLKQLKLFLLEGGKVELYNGVSWDTTG